MAKVGIEDPTVKINELLKLAENSYESNIDKALQILAQIDGLQDNTQQDDKMSKAVSAPDAQNEKDKYWLQRGSICYDRTQNYQEALKCFEQLKGHHLAKQRVADCHRKLNDHAKAIEGYLQGLDGVELYSISKKEEAAIHNNMGLSYRASSKFKEAEKSFTQAMKCDKENALYLCNLGGLLYDQNQTEKALEAWKKAEELFKENKGDDANVTYIKNTLAKILLLESEFKKFNEKMAKINKSKKQAAMMAERAEKVKEKRKKNNQQLFEMELGRTSNGKPPAVKEDSIDSLIKEMQDLNNELDGNKKKGGFCQIF